MPIPKDMRMPFNKLGLNPHLVAATRRMHYTEPTPIQAAAIPVRLIEQEGLAGHWPPPGTV
jgi:superfamily II DNA/RNA helicase